LAKIPHEAGLARRSRRSENDRRVVVAAGWPLRPDAPDRRSEPGLAAGELGADLGGNRRYPAFSPGIPGQPGNPRQLWLSASRHLVYGGGAVAIPAGTLADTDSDSSRHC